jgi:hypothetical protein
VVGFVIDVPKMLILKKGISLLFIKIKLNQLKVAS